MVALAILCTTRQIKVLTCSCWNVVFMIRICLYWFDKSSKKKVEVEEFCFFCDQEHRKIMKHVSTRWLCLDTAVTRTLRLYQPLRSYFLSQEVRPNLVETLDVLFADPMRKIFLFFC